MKPRQSVLDREPLVQYDANGEPVLLTTSPETAAELRRQGYGVRMLAPSLWEARP